MMADTASSDAESMKINEFRIPMPSSIRSLLLAAVLSFVLPAVAQAKVTVEDAWVRETVPAQKTTGAFATVTSTEGGKIVAAKSPVAKVVEIHSSSMKNGVMHMSAVNAVELPAGKKVHLAPAGGYHVMLIDLTRPMKVGDKVPLSFVVQDAAGHRSTVEVQAVVRPLTK
jgi:periplasmic copper chaperone A